MSKNKSWPQGCLWPEPLKDGEGPWWDLDIAQMQDLDEEGEDLLEIKDYMDELVEEGRLNPDYSLNEEYEDWDEDDEEGDGKEEDELWEPEKGLDYWDNGFDLDAWESDLVDHINLLKIDTCDIETDPVIEIRQIIDYSFINENLLRQAFTRRAFSVEYGLSGCSEELEFYGDQVLGMIVTKEIYKRFSDVDLYHPDSPFISTYKEGSLSKMRSRFVNRDYLAERAVSLGLDRFILYGSGEKPNESALEDMMEALIGAVAVDAGWDWEKLEDVVDRLICLQIDQPDDLIKDTYYELFNTWHQRHFGKMPEYEVYRNVRVRGADSYFCTLRFFVPENEKGIWTSQRIDVDDRTRSKAREYAAMKAVSFLRSSGLWINLKDAGMTPKLEDAINQLQELYQKKYVEEPSYSFEARDRDEWYCNCICNGIFGWGQDIGKTKAKKKAAYMVLGRLMKSAGIDIEEV